jgi:opacity protein-like surface antigen
VPSARAFVVSGPDSWKHPQVSSKQIHIDMTKAATKGSVILSGALALLLLLPAADTHAQSGEDAYRFAQRVPGVGVRVLAMGGAGGGGLGEYSDFANNPAGLAYAPFSQIAGSLNFWSVNNDGVYRTTGFSQARSADTRSTDLGHVAYLHRLPTARGALVLGAALTHTSMYERVLSFDGEYTHWTGTRIDHSGRVTDEGGMRTVHLGGAWEAAPGVMVGLVANLGFGRYSFRGIEEHEADLATMVEEIDFDLLEVDDGFTSNMTGFGVRGGLSTAVVPGLRLGVTLESPTLLNVNESFHSRIDALLEGVWYVDEDREGQFDYSVTTPWRLGGGLTYVMDALTLTGDVEIVDWSQMRMRASTDPGYFDDINQDIRERFGVGTNLRAGAEYALGNISLRGGFAYQPDPRQDSQVDRSRTAYSAGLGFIVAPGMELNLAWMQDRFNDRYVPYSEPMTTGPTVDESITRNRFAIGMIVNL